MTEKEVGELYTRLAFQYESSIDSLLARQSIDTDLATTSREKFYDSLNEEKLRTSKKIRDYHETMRLYMRLMTCNDMVSLTELQSNILKNLLDMLFKAGCVAATN